MLNDLSTIHPDLPADRDAVDMILDLARLHRDAVYGPVFDARGGSRYLDGIRDAFIAITGLPEDFHVYAETVLDDLSMHVDNLDQGG